MSKPILFSFTGLDDEVTDDNIQELLQINDAHHDTDKDVPYLEMALLIFPEKEGQPRNPSAMWRNSFLERIRKYNAVIADRKTIGLAAHLCGEAIFQNILKDRAGQLDGSEKQAFDVFMQELEQYDRIQVNINARREDFTPEEVRGVYDYLISKGHALILQLHEDSGATIREYLHSLPQALINKHVRVLVDSSRGRGKAPESWLDVGDKITRSRIPATWRGFAGGINTDNIYGTVKDLMLVNFNSDQAWWTDLESGVRTHNQFDFEKLRVLITRAMSAVDYMSSKGAGFSFSQDGYAIRCIGFADRFVDVGNMAKTNGEPIFTSIDSATIIMGEEQAAWLLNHMNDRARSNGSDYRLELVTVRTTRAVIQTH